MKKYIFFFVVGIIYFGMLCSVSLENLENQRDLDLSSFHNMGNIALRISNYGFIGSGNNIIPQYPSLEWPYNSGYSSFLGINYLYQGAIWIGAKKIRRNEQGVRLYWRPDAMDEYDVVPENSAEYDSLVAEFGPLQLVVDTLTSVGVDGDFDDYELLPAYNPLEMSALGSQYNQYNNADQVLMGNFSRANFDDDGDELIDEDPLGSAFEVDDPDGIFCFTQPFDDDGDGFIDEDQPYPGLQTSVSYFYDYSPFGTPGERDWGSWSGQVKHIPLNIAICQETYTWPVQFYADMIILKQRIYNTNPLDTLFDVSFGYFFDADIGPESWSTAEMATDDISSYQIGVGNEFAYAYDADGDGGLTPGFVALKIFKEDNFNTTCWTWEVGNGPDDSNPLHLNPLGSPTANQKYWLLTGRNPDDSKYTSLRDFPDAQSDNPVDTRFLYSVYGDMQGFDNPTEQSINIAPGDYYDFYTTIFLANSVEELENLSELSDELISSDFDMSLMQGLPSIPYLIGLENLGDGHNVNVRWYSLADETYVCYKLSDAPASDWEYIEVDNDLSEYVVSGLISNTSYKFKIAVQYDDVYLESQTQEITTYTMSAEEEQIADNISFGCFPNPFNPAKSKANIFFTVKTNSFINVEIYNLKGQKVKTLAKDKFSVGSHIINWDGKDENGKPVNSGIYLFNLQTTDRKTVFGKLVLIK